MLQLLKQPLERLTPHTRRRGKKRAVGAIGSSCGELRGARGPEAGLGVEEGEVRVVWGEVDVDQVGGYESYRPAEQLCPVPAFFEDDGHHRAIPLVRVIQLLEELGDALYLLVTHGITTAAPSTASAIRWFMSPRIFSVSSQTRYPRALSSLAIANTAGWLFH
eukprot:CAMPEP_0180284424 /NCGR_PEP_ID=MMETSP0988-20121125/11188_1 /TAXON_ID=697907 /ORGANISM="non described non described, Strain CCMP2293" /LENGTH=162 /DNA_ID=CAMNT_0022257395 /DNA_START=183 /DNA_END=675 /DNA_ORIENTATION=-